MCTIVSSGKKTRSGNVLASCQVPLSTAIAIQIERIYIHHFKLLVLQFLKNLFCRQYFDLLLPMSCTMNRRFCAFFTTFVLPQKIRGIFCIVISKRLVLNYCLLMSYMSIKGRSVYTLIEFFQVHSAQINAT